MPSRASADGLNGIPVGGFRKGKRLPHPRTSTDSYHSTTVAQPRGIIIDTKVAPVSETDSSSPHTLKHASRRIGVPDLPPTPPMHSRQSSGNQQPNITLSSSTSPDPETPTLNSPPTPDVTPPRAMPPLAFRPPVNDRYPSSTSRTDSFKTARETPYCSDEEDGVSTVRPGLPSTRPSENKSPELVAKTHKKKEIGLGLGLESEGTTTPRPNQDSHPEFVIFDGEWGSVGEEVSEVEREWDDNLMRNVMVRKRTRKLQLFTDSPRAEVLEDDIVSPTNATKVVRGLPLQERIAKYRLERDMGRRPEGQTLMTELTPTTPDIRRFSAMSGRSVSSTIIEAMVVDGHPSRRKTLRHSKKQLGLRDFSSDQSTRSSAPNSTISSEPQHKLSYTRSRIPERRQRSLASNTTVSTASSSGKSRREVLKNGGIPVVVIPARRSSSKSSKAPSLRSTSSRKTKRSNSLGSAAPLSQSSKFNEPGYFESVVRKRTLSESAGSGHSIHTIDFPPNIPTRRSSLSAPTSRNVSRAGSLTTESLKAHNLMQEKSKVALESKPVQSAESHSELAQNTQLHVDHNGDPFFGKRLSTQVTPFSQASYETAGTAAEVSEAMAVSLYPHQNKSVLIVQQQAAPSQISRPNIQRKIKAIQPVISINGGNGPVTPPQPIHPMDEVDSPLRNPRAPPEPPAIKFIPPTPAALTPGQEEERQLGYDEQPEMAESKPKRGFSLVRRALSNRRRNSEPVIQAGGLLKRTFSLTGRRKASTDESTQTSKIVANPSTLYPSVEDRPADTSKLHPFWRPAHFWDDLEDNDSGDEDEFGRYPIIDNRPKPPTRTLSGKLKRTFAILPIKDSGDSYRNYYTTERRAVKRTPSGNMRVVKRRSTPTLGRTQPSRSRYVPEEDRFGYGFKEGNGGKRIHTIPGIGIRVEYVGWGGMKQRLSEKRREERSEKLRASISTPRSVRNGIDDVLRRRA